MRTKPTVFRLASLVLSLTVCSAGLPAQGRAGGDGPPPTPKAMAPFDITGTWESVPVEDYRYRMLPPLKFQDAPGRFSETIGIPMNDAARKVALSWNPARDEAAREQCKAYGAANIMRIPGRVRISWQDEQTVMLETDAGMQTRLFEFGTPKAKGESWQGLSRASWDRVPTGRGNFALTGSLKVDTTKLRAGYLMKNGIPYSSSASVTEYYDRVVDTTGEYLVITTTVEDPVYLTQPYLTSTHFKKTDASRWSPTPCATR